MIGSDISRPCRDADRVRKVYLLPSACGLVGEGSSGEQGSRRCSRDRRHAYRCSPNPCKTGCRVIKPDVAAVNFTPTSIAFGSFAMGGVVLELKRLIAVDGVTVYETPVAWRLEIEAVIDRARFDRVCSRRRRRETIGPVHASRADLATRRVPGRRRRRTRLERRRSRRRPHRSRCR